MYHVQQTLLLPPMHWGNIVWYPQHGALLLQVRQLGGALSMAQQ